MKRFIISLAALLLPASLAVADVNVNEAVVEAIIDHPDINTVITDERMADHYSTMACYAIAAYGIYVLTPEFANPAFRYCATQNPMIPHDVSLTREYGEDTRQGLGPWEWVASPYDVEYEIPQCLDGLFPLPCDNYGKSVAVFKRSNGVKTELMIVFAGTGTRLVGMPTWRRFFSSLQSLTGVLGPENLAQGWLRVFNGGPLDPNDDRLSDPSFFEDTATTRYVSTDFGDWPFFESYVSLPLIWWGGDQIITAAQYSRNWAGVYLNGDFDQFVTANDDPLGIYNAHVHGLAEHLRRDLADWLVEIVDDNPADSYKVVGHSAGGTLSQIFGLLLRSKFERDRHNGLRSDSPHVEVHAFNAVKPFNDENFARHVAQLATQNCNEITMHVLKNVRDNVINFPSLRYHSLPADMDLANAGCQYQPMLVVDIAAGLEAHKLSTELPLVPFIEASREDLLTMYPSQKATNGQYDPNDVWIFGRPIPDGDGTAYLSADRVYSRWIAREDGSFEQDSNRETDIYITLTENDLHAQGSRSASQLHIQDVRSFSQDGFSGCIQYGSQVVITTQAEADNSVFALTVSSGNSQLFDTVELLAAEGNSPLNKLYELINRDDDGIAPLLFTLDSISPNVEGCITENYSFTLKDYENKYLKIPNGDGQLRRVNNNQKSAIFMSGIADADPRQYQKFTPKYSVAVEGVIMVKNSLVRFDTDFVYHDRVEAQDTGLLANHIVHSDNPYYPGTTDIRPFIRVVMQRLDSMFTDDIARDECIKYGDHVTLREIKENGRDALLASAPFSNALNGRMIPMISVGTASGVENTIRVRPTSEVFHSAVFKVKPGLTEQNSDPCVDTLAGFILEDIWGDEIGSGYRRRVDYGVFDSTGAARLEDQTGRAGGGADVSTMFLILGGSKDVDPVTYNFDGSATENALCNAFGFVPDILNTVPLTSAFNACPAVSAPAEPEPAEPEPEEVCTETSSAATSNGDGSSRHDSDPYEDNVQTVACEAA